jgi:hypothetical protein
MPNRNNVSTEVAAADGNIALVAAEWWLLIAHIPFLSIASLTNWQDIPALWLFIINQRSFAVKRALLLVVFAGKANLIAQEFLLLGPHMNLLFDLRGFLS